MYCDYFELTSLPFSGNTYFLNLRLSAAQHYFLQKINKNEVIILEGESGTGKSSLACEVARLSQRRTLFLSALPITTEKPENIGRLLACQMQLKKWKTIPSAILPIRLAEAFDSTECADSEWVIIIDNAENLTKDSYAFIRALQSCSLHSKISFLLVEVRSAKKSDIGRRARKAIPLSYYYLAPMSLAECRDYIAHNMQSAGQADDLFNESVIKLLYSGTQGKLGLINELASAALCSAYAEKTTAITYRQMKICLERLGFETVKRYYLGALIAAYIIIGSALGWVYVEHLKPFLPVSTRLSETLLETPAPALSLEDIDNNERSGMQQLFHVWGYDVAPNDAFCDQAVRAQLSCNKSKSTLDDLAKEGLPWLSPIQVGQQKIYVTVVKVTDENLDVLINGDTWTVQRKWFNDVWKGDYIQLMPTTPSGKNGVNGASPKEDTAWLDMTLSNILNIPLSKTGLWDKELVDKVKLFQEREGLAVDGRVGRGTIMQIAKRNGNFPSLITKE